MFFVCFFGTFSPIIHFKLCRFCWLGRKNISCPRAQSTLATPLPIPARRVHPQSQGATTIGRLTERCSQMQTLR